MRPDPTANKAKEIIQINCDVRQGYYDDYLISDEYVFCHPKTIKKPFYTYVAPFHLLNEESFNKYENLLRKYSNTLSFLFPHNSENIEYIKEKGYTLVLDLPRMELKIRDYIYSNIERKIEVKTSENLFSQDFITTYSDQFEIDLYSKNLNDFGLIESLKTVVPHTEYTEYTYVGYLNSAPVVTASMTVNSSKKYGYVTHVVTVKKFQKQGLAKEMMERLIDHAKNLKLETLFLAVEARTPAFHLYKGMGFEEVTRTYSYCKEV